MKDLVVIGSGGFSKQVIEIIEQLNLINPEYKLLGIVDDNKSLVGTEVLGYEVIGDTDYIKQLSKQQKIHGVIAIADGEIREHISRKLNDVQWVNLIHPSAVVSNYTKLGEGNIICAGVVINPECKLGNHSHINIGSTLGHDVLILDYVTVMPGSKVSGNVNLKSKSMVGTGATIIQGLTIEENVVLGAGTVVTKNTKPNYLYVGVPAKEKKTLVNS
ncbi:acetyltransferase [Bacillus sp. MHSD_36]|uniref:acetyltransferase n=1 Tax=unclassified Bacillus (in: firmicutes) TaxID=185979 RepID=UPI0027424121|nr:MULTISPECIES: acetyltransferase [unclassified Bacillus (in: firmicutes)]MDD1367792.1 acetyltransferase [Bacillus sp. MHSD17]MDP7991750.1 acetyltransferase [Bacillus sp. MHSD_36]MDR4980489.1 acetyltransferase [Bacillus sp. MHSD_37]